jgi:cytochrome P450
MNDLRGIFMAGNETTNITIANLMFYLAEHKQYRDELVKETTPVLD